VLDSVELQRVGGGAGTLVKGDCTGSQLCTTERWTVTLTGPGPL
jgi:hypothetical protein